MKKTTKKPTKKKAVKPTKPKKNAALLAYEAMNDGDDCDYFSKLAMEDEDDDHGFEPRIKESDKIAGVLKEVETEIFRAVNMHGPMRSCHEGWAVLFEEVEELWDEVKKKASKRQKENLRMEAIQIAAMAARFVVDLL